MRTCQSPKKDGKSEPAACLSSLRHTGTHTAPRCTISDCEAMRQLVDCIGLSARKKCSSDGVSACTSNALPSYSYNNYN